ncbi:MAG: tetratricopeptide repeat protein [Anaerolineae bacterium]|nr:tetratricopeptide repeat protein [Anaerolineae bacterium]
MYLRTPKRYRPGRRRQLRLISRRTIFTLIVIVGGVLIGKYVWEHQGEVRSNVLPEIEGFAESVQTQVAPKPTLTPTPDLEIAQASCLSSYQQGNLDKAIEDCTVLADNNPNDVDLHYRVTHMLIITSNFGRDAEQLDRALAFAEKTINAAPEEPYGWAIRAMALDWQGNYGPALGSALHAMSLDETFAPTYAFLGEIYLDLGLSDVAQTYLDQALELDTSGLAVADTFRNMGLLYSYQGQWEDAIQPYQAAMQQAPHHSYIAIELANNYVALNQLDEAISVLAAALEPNPQDTGVLFALANIHVRNGNKERAYEYYRRCLDTDPDSIPCLSYLGGLLYYDGNYVTAITNLERAIELGSTDPDDFLQVGQAHAAQGRCDLATGFLQRGYQMVVENENYDKQSAFVNALQACGQIVNQPASASTPTPEATVETPE